MRKTSNVTDEQKAEEFLSALLGILFLLLLWVDVKFVKLLMLTISTFTLISLLWLRRYLSKNGTVIFAFTFVLAIVAIVFNLIFFS